MSTQGALTVGFATVLVMAATLMSTAAPASALNSSYAFDTSFGESLSHPAGIAVDTSASSSSGDIYVSDEAKQSVSKFDSSGHLLGELDDTNLAACPGARNFADPFGVAVDSANGDVYVSDTGEGRVSAFGPTGTCLFQIEVGTPRGIAVNPTLGVDGTLYVAENSKGNIESFDASTGAPISGFGEGRLGAAISLAVGESGDIFVVNEGQGLLEYNPSGECLNACMPIDTSSPMAVVVNPADGHIFVTENEGATNSQIAEYTVAGESPPVLTFGQGINQRGYIYGLAVGNGHLYATNYFANEVDIYEPLPIPEVTTESPTEIGRTSATLGGTVEPTGGEVKQCSFEYGSSAYDYNLGAVPCEPDTPYASLEKVGAQLAELTQGTIYHYRLLATGSNGIKNYGIDRTLETAPAVAGVQTEPPTEVTPISAALNGSFTGSSEETHYHFEWGTTTSYGRSTVSEDVGSGLGRKVVSPTTIQGLHPTTTYHYRIVAENAFGTNYGADETVTPLPNLPTVGGSSISAITPTSATLQAQVNPGFGATTYRFQYGITSSYGSSTLLATSIGSDGSDHLVGADIVGLKPLTTYHFRAIAINFAGTTHGPDQIFTTPDLPTVSGANVTNVTASTAILTAQVNPELAPTTYHFEYGTGPSYGRNTTQSGSIGADDDAHGVSADLVGLTPSTTYHFRVAASNPFGTTVGLDQTITTSAPPSPTIEPPKPCRKVLVKRHDKCIKKRHPSKHHTRRSTHVAS